VINKVLEAAYHKDSSLNACSVDSDCPATKRICMPFVPCIDIPTGETCYLNQCRNILNTWYTDEDVNEIENNSFYGLGVGLSGEILEDGYHRIVQHGGSQTGFKTQFYMDRKDKVGIVVFVAGNDDWKKDGLTYGATKLKNEIIAAFKRHY